ncbi:hypothetical protein [Muricomes intestini]|jgi:hypothetical protein|uniref:Uncharacterized protein n=1 Tax=Muricomes intestini TaxID=1796634 RepID=A0A4R3KDN7_9FIRM|nr:hypothetical protein [Muricomes intestini]TCS80761.1 hypothetical protein EDD59_105144 [Muricomes intestini]HAX53534.1 hypothetical protein [Lachnospiraceae bacterium]HCR83380.1 hypothetical protein [Lachnospiraceae bacterium]
MSQEKVDRYKKEKANRKKIMKKQRIMDALRRTALVLAAFAVVLWLGFSAHQKQEAKKDRPVAEINYNGVNDYMSQLSE